jgi:quercetin dioxygenase-like cupin family protein
MGLKSVNGFEHTAINDTLTLRCSVSAMVRAIPSTPVQIDRLQFYRWEGSGGMKCAHVFTHDAGQTTIGEVDVPFVTAFSDKPLKATRMYSATGCQFVNGKPCFQDWHPAPRRQLLVLLTGELELETGDGKKLTLNPGGMVLVDDTAGKGHITRVNKESVAMYVVVPDGLPLKG